MRFRFVPATVVLTAMVLGACNSGAPAKPRFFGSEADQLSGEGSREEYRLTYLLQMEHNRKHNQEVSIGFDLAAWDDAGHQRFVLEALERPAYTLFTWSSGFLGMGNKFTAGVKSLLDVKEEADWDRGIEHATQAIERWKARYPDLLAEYEWSYDPKIVFHFVEPPAGRFGFYRTPAGTMLFDKDGNLDRRGIHDAAEARYRWYDPEKPDETEDPNFFQGLAAALMAYDTSPFPGGSPDRLGEASEGGWTVETTRTVGAVLQAAIRFNKNIRLAIGEVKEAPFTVSYRAEPAGGDRYRIVGEHSGEGDATEIGQGYRLESYRREVLYDADEERFLADSVSILARHERGDEIRMELVLRDRSLTE